MIKTTNNISRNILRKTTNKINRIKTSNTKEESTKL